MEPLSPGRDRPSSRLWLGQAFDTPFQLDRRLAASASQFKGNSASEQWPVFKLSMAHRLHDIKKLCEACDKIDITQLKDGGPPITLRNSYMDITTTAGRCRFCALLAQYTRGMWHIGRSFQYSMAQRDAPERHLPTRLALQDGMLRVSVSFPEGWQAPPRTSGWDIGSFEILSMKDAGLHDEMVDRSLSVSEISTGPLSTDLLSRLTTELRRITNSTICKECDPAGLPLGASGNTWRNGNSLPILPRRVIEILDISASRPSKLCLRDTKMNNVNAVGDYITLSHRWGGSLTLKLEKRTLSNLLKGFSIRELPRTFRDAVIVAWALGIKYLWIDSLCIIQDDHYDWLQQSALMGSIYSNSTLTLAVHSAAQCNEGFLWRSQVQSTLRIAPGKGGPQFLLSIPEAREKNPHFIFNSSEITCRAWILQELVLSRKIIHFVDNHTFLGCKHHPVDLGGYNTDVLKFQSLQSTQDLHSLWLELISHYTALELTKRSDKLVALAGLLDQWKTETKEPLGRESNYGMFLEDMERSLLWYTYDKANENTRHPHIAPSWSWASINGAVYFMHLELEPRSTKTALIKNITTQQLPRVGLKRALSTVVTTLGMGGRICNLRTTSPLKIRAPFVQITSTIQLEKSSRCANIPVEFPRRMLVMLKDRKYCGWYIADNTALAREIRECGSTTDLERNDLVTVSFLAVSARKKGGHVFASWCIVILAVEERARIYKRVGLGYVRDPESLIPALKSPQDITLI